MTAKKTVLHVLVGALPPPVGGTTLLFEQLVEYLNASHCVNVKIINIGTMNNGLIGKVSVGLRALYHLLRVIPMADSIGFHASIRGIKYGAPLIVMLCRLFCKPSVIRCFGGDLDQAYIAADRCTRALFDVGMLKANALLLETQGNVSFFRPRSKNQVIWYPNSRSINPPKGDILVSTPTHTDKDFVFVGQLRRSKGIVDLITAAKESSWSVDLFGELGNDALDLDLDGDNYSWHGPISNDMVNTVIKRYKALVLPTYYEGEGYPGVILEAFAAGVPVVTTRWRHIAEIVDESCGRLISIKSPAELKKILDELHRDSNMRALLSEGASLKARDFDSAIWAAKYENLVLEISTQ